MSRFYRSCCQYCPLIALSLTVISMAAYSATSSLQPSSSSPTVLLSALPSEPTPIASIATAETIAPPAWSIMSCEKTHPVSCLYSNRVLVSHLEQEFVEQEHSIPDRPPTQHTLEKPLEQNQAIADTSSGSQPVNIDDINRKIRVLTQLKNWLDTISSFEPIEQI